MSQKKSLIAALIGACALLFALAAHATAIYSFHGGESFGDDRGFVEHGRQPLAGAFDSSKLLRGNSGGDELVLLNVRGMGSESEAVALSEWLTDTFVLSGLSNYLKDRELATLLREDRLIYGDGSADRLARLLGSGKNHKCGPGDGGMDGKCECSSYGASCKHRKEVPEPGTLGLAAAALLGSAYLLVRRRRSGTADLATS
jgi:hypothetical protein